MSINAHMYANMHTYTGLFITAFLVQISCMVLTNFSHLYFDYIHKQMTRNIKAQLCFFVKQGKLKSQN